MTFNSLRVATYNLSCMSQQAKNKAQAQLLEEQKVDLVGLQEVN
jgi:exonuclease III